MYREKSPFETLLNMFLIPFYLLWRLLVFITSGISKLVVDVMKNVYGKVVVALGAIVFAILVIYITHFLK